jgi:uncharacterized ion transporter superfamily protein YfcC
LNRPRFRAPNTFVILGGFLLLVAVLTWMLPGGQYERVESAGRTVVVPGSFETVATVPQGPAALLLAPIRGFVEAALIIGFVLIVGGAFGIIEKSGAIVAAIGSLAGARGPWGRLVRRFWIPLLVVLFSLGGAIFGMGEELIPFILVFVPLSLALGYDRVVGVAVAFVGTQAGFAGAFLNPFTVGIAQGISGLAPFSGFGYRLVVWAVVTVAAAVYIQIYAARVRRRPELSPTFDQDEKERAELHLDRTAPGASLSARHAAVLGSFGLGMVVLCVGVTIWGWYIEEIAALFVALGLVAGLLAKLRPAEMAEAFLGGARSLVATAFVIALARAVLVLAEDGRIIDTILHGLASIVDGVHPIVAAQLMFVVQTALNLFVPSGSGQAALTMPIMAPLADLLGVSRQTAVLAFQLGDGFTNMIVPTSGVCMGILTLARIDWLKWLRWILPLQLIFILLGLLLLVPPFFFDWR